MTPPPDDNGTQLMARPLGRDTSIESLFALHDRDVRSALRRVLGRSQEEDDLVQEVFTRLVVRLRQPGDLCVGAWVRGVAHNLAVDEVRRRRPVPVEDIRLDREVTGAADEAVAGADLYSRLVEGAHGLPERQRAALAAALSSGAHGTATVASRLGVSVHAAESLLSRARVGLRTHLAMSGCDDGGSLRMSLGAALAAVALVAAGVVRRWRLATVLTAATVATGAVAGVTLLPAVGDPARPAPATSVEAVSAPTPTASDDAAGGIPADGTDDAAATPAAAGTVPTGAAPVDGRAPTGPDRGTGLGGLPLPDLGAVPALADLAALPELAGLPAVALPVPPVSPYVPAACATGGRAAELAQVTGEVVGAPFAAPALPTDAVAAATGACGAAS